MIRPKEQVVQGIPIGKLNNHEIRITALEHGGGVGSGFQLPLTGSVDASNQTFTWTTAPNVLVVDGAPIQKTQQDGTVNWSGTTTTLLTTAPVYSICAIA